MTFARPCHLRHAQDRGARGRHGLSVAAPLWTPLEGGDIALLSTGGALLGYGFRSSASSARGLSAFFDEELISLQLVGTRRADRLLAKAFCGDAERLRRDATCSGTRRRPSWRKRSSRRSSEGGSDIQPSDMLRPVACAAASFLVAFLAAPVAFAQETFFQIPSGLIAPKGEVFSQQQATVNRQLDLAAQGVFGLGRGFEVGLSVYNFDLKRFPDRGVRLVRVTQPGDEPLGPLAMLTAQKSLAITRRFSFTAGTQTGTQVLGHERHLVTREYVNTVYAIAKETRFLVGGWHANGNYVGGDRRFGVWIGAELEIVHDRLSVEADFVSGRQANGATSVGPKIMFTEDVSLTVGAQIPNPHGEAKWAGLAQLEVDDFVGLF